MYQVSEAYREQMEKPMRNISHVKIVFSLSDPDALRECDSTDDGHVIYSDVSEITDLEVKEVYKTLEDNHFLLNGLNSLLPDTAAESAYQGYCGNELSMDDTRWFKPPVVTVRFGEYFKFSGLSMQFDLEAEEFPAKVRVLAYKDQYNVFYQDVYFSEENLVDAGGVTYLTVSQKIPEMNRIEIHFLESGKPYRRARLLSLVLGDVQTFDATSVTNCKQIVETDVIASKLPRNDFDFTIFDTQKSYDPENPSGIWDYLESRQPVRFMVGYELDDNKIEWMPCCKTFSTGDVTVNRTGVLTEVAMKTTSIIDHLDMEYNEGVYHEEGRSFAELARDVMEFAGYPHMLDVTSSLYSYKTTVPLPVLPVNQCLQLIANAAMCRMFVKRDGAIAIKPTTGSREEFNMDFSRMTETPKTTRYPQLRTLAVEYQNATVEEALSEVVSKAEVKEADSTEVEYTHEAITGNTVTTSGLTVVSSKFYAHKTVLVLTGSGTVTIKGKKIVKTPAKYSHTYNTFGDDLQVSNELISSQSLASSYALWIMRAMERRNEYTAPDRGYPELDVNDDITFMPNSENQTPVTILRRELSYNGAISGSGKYLIGGKYQWG